jgi:hypothetical protein
MLIEEPVFDLAFDRVLGYLQDSDPIDSFYYVNWDDPIYDQFEDYSGYLFLINIFPFTFPHRLNSLF